MNGKAIVDRPICEIKIKKVNWPHPAVSWEFGVAVEVMVRDIAQQKQCREHSSGDHKPHVDKSIAAPYIGVSKKEANGAE